MTKLARVYEIERLIKDRGHISFQALMDELEVSRATLKRDLDYLRDRLGSPIVFDRFLGGYRFDETAKGKRHELPGLWFDERELYSLLMANQLLRELDSQGAISRHLQPLMERIPQILGHEDVEAKAVMERVKIIAAGKRPVPSRHFELVCEAALKRRRVHMRYTSRGRQDVNERDISPQRLVHYRSTWYVDAWCHKARALRRFALDAIEAAQMLDTAAKDVPLEQVELEMDGGYGIYAGGEKQWAVLSFTPQSAQWISREQWHPDQVGRWLEDGRYELKVPFGNDTEIVMDVLRYGDHVEVLKPDSLREQVMQRIEAMSSVYSQGCN